MKKKKYRFGIHLDLLDLTSVPYVSGNYFAKLRLRDGGDFENHSARVAVVNHTVLWDRKFSFSCKMHASSTTGILDGCILRVSVRRDGKGGKVDKLGFVDINLAEFAGAGVTEKRFILQRYNTEHRVANSILRLKVLVSLQEGDPLFKRPSTEDTLPSDLAEESRGGSAGSNLHPVAVEGGEVGSAMAVGPDNGSVVGEVIGASPAETPTPSIHAADFIPPYEGSPSILGESLEGHMSGHDTFPRVHRRTNRHWLTASTHRRNVSWDSARLTEMVNDTTLRHELATSESGLASIHGQTRLSSTRVDACGIVDEVMSSAQAKSSASGEASGLQLFVSRDGTATVSGRKSDRHSAHVRPFVIEEGK